MNVRQVVLDTETTGLEVKHGHRLIEIGGVEILNRRVTGQNFHCYLQPDRESDPGAVAVHGITDEFLADKPRFPEVAAEFLAFIEGAELVIHNAPFDVGFLNNELEMIGAGERVDGICQVTDTLELARKRHPGQRNSLDALCKRYGVDNSKRELHGALLDSEILADVFLAMTGGQMGLSLDASDVSTQSANEQAASTVVTRRERGERADLPVIRASEEELAAHEQYLQALDKASDGACVWNRIL